jgi:hypothetical protein
MISPGMTATHLMPSLPYWVATLRGCNRLRHLCLVRRVESDRGGPGPGFHDRVGDDLRSFLVLRGDDHSCSCCRERARRGLTDAAGRSGYECDLPVELSHRQAPSLVLECQGSGATADYVECGEASTVSSSSSSRAVARQIDVSAAP